jgi:hypothetical protein
VDYGLMSSTCDFHQFHERCVTSQMLDVGYLMMWKEKMAHGLMTDMKTAWRNGVYGLLHELALGWRLMHNATVDGGWAIFEDVIHTGYIPCI